MPETERVEPKAGLQAGQRVGNYVLRELTGRGAFGEVWKAVHYESPHRVRALKIATNPEFRRQLSREGGLPDIDHPNVVPVLDSDTLADPPYVVMPFVPGGNLADLLTRHRNGLPEERSESLMEDILAGLSAAHERGLVHRDIKPQNVLLEDDGRGRLTDFGLSTADAVPDAERSLIQSLSISIEHQPGLAGTLAYMAPEVLAGQRATKASDVFSVGVLLFEMLTGRRPAGIELPSQRCSDLREPARWDSLYSGACRPVETRYPDAMAMARELRALRETQAGPSSVRTETGFNPPAGSTGVAGTADDALAAARPRAVAQLSDALSLALVDGPLTLDERLHLRELRLRLGTSTEVARRLFAEVRAEVAERSARRLKAPIAEAAILRVLSQCPPHRNFHVHPAIPAHKLSVAQQRCTVDSDERVLGLLDCTVFGTAKNCVVLTTMGIRYYVLTGKLTRGTVPYLDLAKRSWTTETHMGLQRVHIDGFAPIDITMSGFSAESFADILAGLRDELDGPEFRH